MSRARKRRGRKQWEKIVADWRVSGRSQAEYCREKGLSPHTFSWWKTRLAKEGKQESPRPAFVEVKATRRRRPPVERPMLEVQVGANVVVRVPKDFDKGALVRLIGALREVRAC